MFILNINRAVNNLHKMVNNQVIGFQQQQQQQDATQNEQLARHEEAIRELREQRGIGPTDGSQPTETGSAISQTFA